MSKDGKQDKVFSQPIRKMTVEEIDQVAGGLENQNEISGMKGSGWPDNQSKNQTG